MKKNYLLVKYEDLITDPLNGFSKISKFISQNLKLKFSEEQILNASKLSSFNNLEKMEKTYGFTESSTNTDGSKNKFFYLGPRNNWETILDKDIIDEINREFEIEMKELKYL